MMLFLATSRGIALRMSVLGSREGRGVDQLAGDGGHGAVAGCLQSRAFANISCSRQSARGTSQHVEVWINHTRALTKRILFIAVVSQHSSVDSVAKLRRISSRKSGSRCAQRYSRLSCRPTAADAQRATHKLLLRANRPPHPLARQLLPPHPSQHPSQGLLSCLGVHVDGHRVGHAHKQVHKVPPVLLVSHVLRQGAAALSLVSVQRCCLPVTPWGCRTAAALGHRGRGGRATQRHRAQVGTALAQTRALLAVAALGSSLPLGCKQRNGSTTRHHPQPWPPLSCSC